MFTSQPVNPSTNSHLHTKNHPFMYKSFFTILFSLFATTLFAQQSSSIEGEIEGISEGQLQLIVRSSESR